MPEEEQVEYYLDSIKAVFEQCAAALKTIEIMERDDLAGRSCEIGEKVMARYGSFKEKYECVGDFRGMGADNKLNGSYSRRPLTGSDPEAPVFPKWC